ncbi:MAG: efflux RND transporter permease subunit, partial [Bdellovibrionales bacterium]|nr:efflux RND transporter permease subunit [Bdellovibrionales bacterium]
MKALTEFVLNSRLFVLTMAVLMMIVGYYCYKSLPIDAFPDVSPNLVQVFTVTEGLAPEEIEKFVTYPVEVAMNGLPGVEKVRSVSNFGLSVVNVYFDEQMDLYFARQLVGERLQAAREQIPAGFGDPELGPISTGMGLILFYYIDDSTGTHTLEELRTIQDWIIKPNLQNTPGVTEVLGIGGYEKQFHVIVHPELLLQYEITITELIEALRANNVNIGASFIEKNSEEFVVRSVGLATGIEDIKSIVLKTVDGTPIYVRQVADVEVGGAVRRGLETRNGIEEVVAGMVVKLFGANSTSVIERVEQKVTEINRALPQGVRVVPYYEQKSLVEACVNTVYSALIQGIACVVLVLFAFMGTIHAGFIVAFSIPFSVLFAFVGMHFLGISANLMSFGGLAIAIGMMVDGTIVV